MKIKKAAALLVALLMMTVICCVNVSAATVKKGITLSKTTLTMSVGETETLKATVGGYKKYTIVWTTSKNSVVSVSKGKLTAKKAGTAKITAKIKNTSYKAVCNVTVSSASGSADAIAFVKNIKAGWNLGNTLDALGSGVESETCWGNIKTTEAMIKAVKNEGFNAVRIPVSWGKHMDGKYKVDKAWMDRVQEIVDYAIDNDMYVILNSHHDNEWTMPKSADYKNSEAQFKSLWTQISERFKDYDEHLIFEGMNEPRTEGTAQEWNGGTAPERKQINRYLDIFVDTVRSSGGKNAQRYIMFPTYAASLNGGAVNDLEIPDDKRFIVSVHSYSPYNMALNRNSNQTAFDANGKREVDNVIKTINDKFISKGQAVIIGECGSMNKQNDKERAALAEYYTSAAKGIGVPCFWWDNGTKCPPSEGEGFGILDRSTLKWWFKDVADAFVRGAE